MPRVITGPGHVPIWLWGRTVPEGALEQLRWIASQPYVVDHVAGMPDLHVARGVAVGTVFATEATLVPQALGGDLGCGMSALRFDFPAARLSAKQLERLLVELGRVIPVGDATHRGRGVAVPDALLAPPLSTGALEHARERLAPRHLGTLGGGNHFVELDRDAAGDLWLLVHSGSRGLGAAIAGHHLRSAAGEAGLSDYEWALEFARANREVLVRRAAELVSELTGQPPAPDLIDAPHNFVRREEHRGRLLLVHRKGAIAAPPGVRALIPGSMGTSSYIVEGLGAPDAFGSASHGAGRVLTRRAAREQIRPERLVHAMRRVVFDRRRAGLLVEEAPEAYRDLAEVLEDEQDLVTPVLRLEPIAVLKG